MRRLYEPRAYNTAAWPDSHWRASSIPLAPYPALKGADVANVVVIGAGYAGLSAAMTLAERGMRVVVLEAGQPGWGASGRNGGFCSMGGSKLPDTMLARRYGRDEAVAFRRFQRDAVAHVAGVLEDHDIDAQAGPQGALCLAHSEKAFAALKAGAEAERRLDGEAPEILSQAELKERGLHSPAGYGGALHPVGFPLHPMRYVLGLAQAAVHMGAVIHGDSMVKAITRDRGRWHVETEGGEVIADMVLVATNGYTSDDLPPWIEGRTLPAMSNILVTRPLTEAERKAQGWTSQIMTHDSRTLLHYFRLLPDNRFLFGMRGGLSADPREEEAVRQMVRGNFAAMFPAWAGVGIEKEWSGLVCLTGSLTPFVGPVPGTEGMYAAFGWHGNGVSSASYGGHLAGRMMAGEALRLPTPLSTPPSRFPVPMLRRQLMRLTYLMVGLAEGRPRPQQEAA